MRARVGFYGCMYMCVYVCVCVCVCERERERERERDTLPLSTRLDTLACDG